MIQLLHLLLIIKTLAIYLLKYYETILFDIHKNDILNINKYLLSKIYRY